MLGDTNNVHLFIKILLVNGNELVSRNCSPIWHINSHKTILYESGVLRHLKPGFIVYYDWVL